MNRAPATNRAVFVSAAMRQGCRVVLTALAVLTLVADAAGPDASLRWTDRRAASSFDRATFVSPDHAAKVRSGGTLSGGANDWGIAGVVAYDFEVPKSAWYEIHTIGAGPGVEYFVDADETSTDPDSAYFYGTSGMLGRNDGVTGALLDKVGNVWLEKGNHTLRMQRYLWTGFPRIGGFVVTEASPTIAHAVRPRLPEAAAIFRRGQCPPLRLEAGGPGTGGPLTLVFHDTNGRERATRTVRAEAAPRPKRLTVPLYCDEPGSYRIHYREGARDIDWREIPELPYEVIDTARGTEAAAVERALVQEIDCVREAPAYQSGGTEIRRTAAGAYRESGDTGFTLWQRAPLAARPALPAPSWFAYTATSIRTQQAYVVDVDYPDDALRTFTVSVRESLRPEGQPTYVYPVSVGVDSGGEFSLSRALQTQTLMFWARADAPRIVFQTAHGGRRAACSRIRVYRIGGDLPPLNRQRGGRIFASWYEEGDGFLSYFGAREHWRPGALSEATKRAVMALRHMGYTTFMPTVSVYESTLYPSRFNRKFSQPDRDLLRQLLLHAEAFGMNVVAELHPRCDEFSWPGSGTDDPSAFLISKDGMAGNVQSDGRTARVPPLLNPLHPEVQRRYVAMIGELADRYRDSPAFSGVAVRLMEVTNPGLSNFHSLDWGYDDTTIAQFVRDTGVTVPGPAISPGGVPTPAIAQARHRWILANARETWVSWRVARVTALFGKIVERVRRTRPNLQVYVDVFARGALDTLSGGGADAAAGWLEAGVDGRSLGGIEGLVLVNATHAYGRREASLERTQPLRDELLDPHKLRAFLAPSRAAAFLGSANYVEQTELVLPPQALGLPPDTKHGWTSSPAFPAGRHLLERFAVQLAETDAVWLGDGGNGYALAQPRLRDWLAEYETLPSEAFAAVPSATDPVAVRMLRPPASRSAEGIWFYAVNRERYPVRLTITMRGAGTVTRPARNRKADLTNDELSVELQPYELQTFRANAAADIVSVAAAVPESARVHAREIVESLERMANGPLAAVLLSGEQRVRLRRTVGDLRAALSAGRYWQVRTVAESWPMQEIYRKLRSSPPDLRDD